MSHAETTRIEALMLRRQGVSIPAIARRLHISKSTAFLWVGHLRLTKQQADRLVANSVDGREKGREAMCLIREGKQHNREQQAQVLVSKMLHPNPSKEFWQLLAAMLFWCEGGKRGLTSLRFANSDPRLIRVFLHALRKGFDIQEKKFRAVIHLHGYHDEVQQKAFWSKVTGIPLEQFSKAYRKPNTGRRKRDGYPGCLSVRYNDANLARTLDALYHAFGNTLGAW